MKDVEQLKISLSVEDALRRLFLVSIDSDSLKEILNLSENFGNLLKEHKFIKSIKECVYDGLSDEARYEYNRLFVGPRRPKAVPYESTYFDHKNMFGSKTLQVRELYERAGLKLTDEQLDKFPDDFIGYELQYLYYMSFLAIQSVENDDKFYEILRQKQEFLHAHPSLWFDKFALDCQKETSLEIWKNFADFLLVYLKRETEILAKITAKMA